MFSIFTYQCGYWSVWALFSAILFDGIHRCFDTNQQQVVKNVVWMMLSSASIGGLYITYYHPRRLYLPHLDVELVDTSLILCDVLGHHVPWYVFTKKYILRQDETTKISRYEPLVSTSIFSLLSILYYTHADWKTRYSILSNDVFVLIVLFFPIHFYLSKKMKRFKD
jgi:hypothetical protein